MDCGIPFCHQGCPLGNLIPDWNDLVYAIAGSAAIERLHATNNFPEFTGKLCPAPCEGSCVLGINDDPVTIKAIEGVDHRSRLGRRLGDAAAADHAHVEEGRGRRLRSGGAGRRRSAESRRPLGDRVREVRSHRRAAALRHPRIQDGEAHPRPPARGDGGRRRDVPRRRQRRRRRADGAAARATSTRSCWPAAPASRATCRCPGASCKGIHFAMDYLTLQNRRCEGDAIPDAEFITAKDKHVIIIGGGDTGADCLGTAHRQGARSVHQLELMPHAAGGAARRTIRGRSGRRSSASRPRTKKAASGSTRCRRSGSPATRTGASRRCTPCKVEMVQQGRPHRSSSRWPAASSRSTPTSCCWRWASSGPRRARCSTISAWS